MSKNPIQSLVDAAVFKADEHAQLCADIADTKGLAAALEYIAAAGLTPPTCSLTAESANAERLRFEARRKLSDPKWWAKSLKQKTLQDFENDQRLQGKVTNFVSDAMTEYMSRRR